MKPGKNIQHRLHHNNSEQVKVFVLAFTEGSQNSNGGGWYYKPKHITFVLVPISAHKLSYIFFFFFGELKQTVISFCFQMQAEQHHLFSVLSSEAPNRKKNPEIRFLVFVWVWEWLSSWGCSSCRTSEFCLQLEQKARSALCVQVYFTHRACSDWKRRWKTTLICTTSVSQSVCMCVWVCVMRLISRSVNHTQALLKPMISTDQG